MLERFAFVEYQDRRDADDAYHEMHNKRIGRDDLLKIEVGDPRAWSLASYLQVSSQWARTPPSASWRFDSGRDRPRERRDRSPPPRRRSISPRRRDVSPRKDDRRDRDYDRRDRDHDRRDRDHDRSRSPEGRDRDRDREREREREPKDDRRAEEPEEVNGDSHKGVTSLAGIPLPILTKHSCVPSSSS